MFTGIDRKESTDLSVFFWLSMLCLLFSLVLIIILGVYYHFYISEH